MVPANANVRAPGVPYFTPAQIPPAGTAIDPQPDCREISILFRPIQFRGVHFQKRIWVSHKCHAELRLKLQRYHSSSCCFKTSDVMRGIGATSSYPSAKVTATTAAAGARPPRLLVATVGAITNGVQAEDLLKNGDPDIVLVGRFFQKNPGTVWAWAEDLDRLEIKVANQIGWGFRGRGKKALQGCEENEKTKEK
ncbi:hypothetical protein GALMADRAFT_208187 [Galerina marginata CBS 339.88]|uniref:NADH:flavin oxidoreductase/NADH oxidase N-terminal domain-containing protein n=1 Tax=Galerina marginata (strain CBS 339.88) TaxID=685588 RepID=A0A067TJ45_GALM3|nr:hypothetical protein GALMADRAFT_208187 [Galerina marginata CBS 339.88]